MSAAASTSASASSGADGSDARLHEAMDKMDDLGFAAAQVDGLADAIESGAFDASAPLARIFTQLLGDLAAFAHGQLRQPHASLQQEIVEALQKEGFPYASLLQAGPSFLDGSDGRILSLDFLLSAVQAAKMMALRRHKRQQQQRLAQQELQARSDAASTNENKRAGGNAKKRGGAEVTEEADIKRARSDNSAAAAAATPAASSDAMEDVASSSEHAEAAEITHELRLLAATLQIVWPSNPDGAAVLRQLRTHLTAWLRESPLRPAACTLPPLFTQSSFNSKQLAVLRDMFATFHGDYNLRVHVIRKRLEVTLQSFMWGGKGATCSDEITKLASMKLATFPRRAQVEWYELWAATPVTLHIARMTSREYAQRSSIKRVIIGAVPDRGGRVDTNSRLQADYDMPAFTARSAGGDEGGFRSARGGGRGGGQRHGGGGNRGRGR